MCNIYITHIHTYGTCLLLTEMSHTAYDWTLSKSLNTKTTMWYKNLSKKLVIFKICSLGRSVTIGFFFSKKHCIEVQGLEKKFFPEQDIQHLNKQQLL